MALDSRRLVQQQRVDENTEKKAKAYVNDLITRSLVTVTISRREHLGGVKASRLHDLSYDFA